MPPSLKSLGALTAFMVAGCIVAGCSNRCDPITESVVLPTPTGQFKVGRIAYYLIDPRLQQTDQAREIMVYVWYPADIAAAGELTPYIPDWNQAKDRIAESVKRGLGEGKAYCALEQNPLLIHAIKNAPFASTSPRYPVLLFSHGTAVASLTYAAQHEDLASHGYVVAALEYTPATPGFVTFPDGRANRFDPQRWQNPGKTQEEILQWEKRQIDGLANAFRFVLDELARTDNQAISPPLSDRLDFSQVGVFGHSFGGMGALRATQLDGRIRAGLNQEGLSDGMVSFATAGLSKPFGLMFRDYPERYTETRAIIARLFRALPNGISFTMKAELFEHLSFSDLEFLRAFEDTSKRAAAARNLTIVREFTRAFFDVHLRGQPPTLLDVARESYPEVAIERARN